MIICLKVIDAQQKKKWVRLGCRIKANCPLVGPGPAEGVPSMEVFLRNSEIEMGNGEKRVLKNISGGLTILDFCIFVYH